MPAPTVTLTIEEAAALALVLRSTEEAATVPAAIAAAAGDALDLLQDATARTAGIEHVALV